MIGRGARMIEPKGEGAENNEAGDHGWFLQTRCVSRGEHRP